MLGFNERRETHARDEAGFEGIPDDIGRGDPCIGVDARDAEGMVMVPHEPCALVVGVVVLRFVNSGGGVQNVIVQETQSVGIVRGPPVEGAAVADPGDEAAVEVDQPSGSGPAFAPGMLVSTGMMFKS